MMEGLRRPRQRPSRKRDNPPLAVAAMIEPSRSSASALVRGSSSSVKVLMRPSDIWLTLPESNTTQRLPSRVTSMFRMRVRDNASKREKRMPSKRNSPSSVATQRVPSLVWAISMTLVNGTSPPLHFVWTRSVIFVCGSSAISGAVISSNERINGLAVSTIDAVRGRRIPFNASAPFPDFILARGPRDWRPEASFRRN